MIVWPTKDPDETLDYSWTIPLDSGDTVQSFSITPVSGTVAVEDDEFSGAVATAWLSGGVDGETATFTLLAVTSGGRTFEEMAALAVAANTTAAAALIAAFPRFAAVPSPTLAFWLTRAARSVDDSWTEDDVDMGRMLLAAHLMTLQGLGTGAEAEAAAAGAGDFKTIRSGSLTLERFERAAGATQGDLAATSYGQQFAALARQNRSGPRVMATGTLATSWPERT